MSNEAPKFDAYYKWLGIPRREQPPSHYRLLGIKLYESDENLIRIAAERQAKFIYNCGREKYLELAEKIITEVAVARDCLLDAQAKMAYDEELKKQTSSEPAKRRRRQSRFDVQVAHDYQEEAAPINEASNPAGAIKIITEAPAAAAPPAPPLPPIEEMEDALYALADEVSPSASTPQPARPLQRVQDLPNPPIDSKPVAKKVKSTPTEQADGNNDAGKIVKLVVAACVLAGGVTVGLLMWLSSGRKPAIDTLSDPIPTSAPAVATFSPKAVKTSASNPSTQSESKAPAPSTMESAAATAPASQPPPSDGKLSQQPAVAPAGVQPAPAGQTPAAAKPGPVAPPVRESGWNYPLRSLEVFRTAWINANETASVDYNQTNSSISITASGELGGFQLNKPWKEIGCTLYAEAITGRLEVQVNKTTLKFETATALIRKPAKVSIQYDPVTSKLSAIITGRTVASATVLEDNFTSSLICRFRCEGGKAKLKLSEVKVFVP